MNMKKDNNYFSLNYKICFDWKIGHVFALNEGMGNINDVPVNKKDNLVQLYIYNLAEGNIL